MIIKKSFPFILILIQFYGCASFHSSFHQLVPLSLSNQVERNPSGNGDYFKAMDLKRKKPLEILEMLKNECCQSRIMETIETKGLWSEEDLIYVRDYLNDSSEASSVSKSTSSLDCHGEKYQSTVKREAMHLIMAVKLGYYPVSQCSTIDLKID